MLPTKKMDATRPPATGDPIIRPVFDGRIKMNVAKMMLYVFDREENIVGKGENAGYQHFLLCPECFQKAFSSGVLKVVIVWKRVKSK